MLFNRKLRFVVQFSNFQKPRWRTWPKILSRLLSGRFVWNSVSGGIFWREARTCCQILRKKFPFDLENLKIEGISSRNWLRTLWMYGTGFLGVHRGNGAEVGCCPSRLHGDQGSARSRPPGCSRLRGCVWSAPHTCSQFVELEFISPAGFSSFLATWDLGPRAALPIRTPAGRREISRLLRHNLPPLFVFDRFQWNIQKKIVKWIPQLRSWPTVCAFIVCYNL